MLNERPKKAKKAIDYSHPTKSQLFWRTQKECWRRMVTPYLMYFFMSLIMLSCQAIGNLVLRIALGLFCIAGGAFFNAHLLLNTGEMHYGVYVSGELHRRNEALGIVSGGDHRPEREYRPWKGFYIGFLIGVPVVILGGLSGRFLGVNTLGNYIGVALLMFAGWAIIPITWFGSTEAGMNVSPYFSILFVILPIVISGVFYLLGASREKRKRLAEEEHNRKVEEAREAAREKMLARTEEQRKRDLQGKKKKKK